MLPRQQVRPGGAPQEPALPRRPRDTSFSGQAAVLRQRHPLQEHSRLFCKLQLTLHKVDNNVPFVAAPAADVRRGG